MQPEDLDAAQRDALLLRRYYESPKSLGQLFRAIPRSIAQKETYYAPILPAATDGTAPDDEDFAVDEPVTAALRTALTSVGFPCKPPPLEDLSFGGQLMARYALELRHIALANTLVSSPGRGLSEAELVMGLISTPSGSMGRRRDAIERAQTAAADLVRAVRRQLNAPRPRSQPVVPQAPLPVDPQLPDVDPPPPTAINGTSAEVEAPEAPEEDDGRRAWAAWCVATRAPKDKWGCRSFGLVALGAVMDVVEKKKAAIKEEKQKELKDAVDSAAKAASVVTRPR